MAEYTETFDDVKKRWAALCGLDNDTLQTVDVNLFTQFANKWLRDIWNKTMWPETTTISSEALTDQKFTAGSSIAWILGIFDVHPLSTLEDPITRLRYYRIGEEVYVYGDDVPSTVYVLYKDRLPTFNTGANTIPHRFAEYVAQGAFADWLQADEQFEASRLAKAEAQNLLSNELDIYERQEQHSRWMTPFVVHDAPNI